MRRNRSWLWGMVAGLAVTGWAAREATSVTVQLKKGELRAQPSMLAPVVASAEYGRQLPVLETRGAWRRVDAGGVEGWIHANAVTGGRVTLSSGASDVQSGASSGEVNLAGKGFTEQVEQKYKQTNPKLDFTWVDRMLGMRADTRELLKFIKDGSLKEGAQ